MTKKTRITALLLAAAILTVMLCSAFYLALEAGHDCIGDGCAICCQIAVCRNVLKNFRCPSAPQPLLLRLHTLCAGMFLPARTTHKAILWYLSRSNFQIK